MGSDCINLIYAPDYVASANLLLRLHCQQLMLLYVSKGAIGLKLLQTFQSFHSFKIDISIVNYYSVFGSLVWSHFQNLQSCCQQLISR